MAASPEHDFLSRTAIEALDSLSGLGLYGFQEADRRKFDFACSLTRDWTTPVVGQTLWKHVEGVDKDLRTLLLEPQAEVLTYVARHDAKAASILREALSDFRQSSVDARLHRLKVFWIPPDFDADNEEHRVLIRESLSEQISRDILLNVVLGQLSYEHIALFNDSSGVVGLDFAVLYEIDQRGFLNYPDLSDRLHMSSGPLRERVLRLLGCGFIQSGARAYTVTPRGRVFLELCALLTFQTPEEYTPELQQLLRLLGLAESAPPDDDGLLSRHPLTALLVRVRTAIASWGLDLSMYPRPSGEL